MTHLTELHMSDSPAELADSVRIRAILMHTDLENAAQAIAQVKTLVESRNPTPSEKDSENSQMQVLLQKADALISQMRSAKVVCAKAIQQLETLNARSLMLSPSSLSTLQDAQSLVSQLASASNAAGFSLIRYLDTDDTNTVNYTDMLDAVSPGDMLPFASLLSKAQQTVTSLQTFYTLTNTLSHTVELPESTSRTAPWEVLAEHMRAENAAFGQYEHEAIRLRAEVKEKNTSLVMKDKALDEMAANMEVLEKRMGDSGGRRERVRELEGELELARAKTCDVISKAERLERELKAAESEREGWRKQASDIGSRTDTDTLPQSIAREKEVTPSRAREEIERLQTEVSILQSTIRHLRLSTHQAIMSSSQSFLSTPLITKHKSSSAKLRSQEARDVLNSMLQLVTHPQSQVVQLRPRSKENRLRWRPMRETPGWQVSGQKELWAGWTEWRDDAGRQLNRPWQGFSKKNPPLSISRYQDDVSDGVYKQWRPGIGKPVTEEVAVVGSADYEGKVDLGMP